jgi:hypothetical protein
MVIRFSRLNWLDPRPTGSSTSFSPSSFLIPYELKCYTQRAGPVFNKHIVLSLSQSSPTACPAFLSHMHPCPLPLLGTFPGCLSRLLRQPHSLVQSLLFRRPSIVPPVCGLLSHQDNSAVDASRPCSRSTSLPPVRSYIAPAESIVPSPTRTRTPTHSLSKPSKTHL